MSYIGKGAKQAIAAQRAAKRAKQREQEREDMRSAERLSWEAQNKRDRDDVAELLERDDLFDKSRAWLQNVYLWLSIDSGRTLTPSNRTRFSRLRHALRCVDRGASATDESDWQPKHSRPLPRGRRRKEELPDWLLGKPPELPVRPPTRADEPEPCDRCGRRRPSLHNYAGRAMVCADCLAELEQMEDEDDDA